MNARVGTLVEGFLFALGFSLFATAVGCLVWKVPVGPWLFGWVDRFEIQQVGTTATLKGQARRKVAIQSDFLPLSDGTALYNYDTIITEPDSTAVLQFSDGSTLELGPRTMVKIEFTPKATEVRVARGSVTSRAKRKPIVVKPVAQLTSSPKAATAQEPTGAPEIRVEPLVETIAVRPSPVPIVTPVPSPQPLASAAPSPRPSLESIPFVAQGPGTKIQGVSAEMLKAYPLEIRWHQAKQSTLAVIRLVDGISKRTLRAVDADLSKFDRAKIAVTRPGPYEWQVQHENKLLFKKSVSVPAQVDGLIHVLDPLVSGLKTRSTEYTGVLLKNLELTLRWKSEVPLTRYRLRIFKSDSEIPYYEASINREEYVLTEQRVPRGKIYYQIDGKTPEGFVLSTPRVAFQFDYVPPVPMNPKSQEVIRLADLESNPLLFTWKKTNFTEFYELEVAYDVDFQRMAIRHKTSENFFAESQLRPGHYFWRVRSFANGVYSPATPASEFTLK